MKIIKKAAIMIIFGFLVGLTTISAQTPFFENRDTDFNYDYNMNTNELIEVIQGMGEYNRIFFDEFDGVNKYLTLMLPPSEQGVMDMSLFAMDHSLYIYLTMYNINGLIIDTYSIYELQQSYGLSYDFSTSLFERFLVFDIEELQAVGGMGASFVITIDYAGYDYVSGINAVQPFQSLGDLHDWVAKHEMYYGRYPTYDDILITSPLYLDAYTTGYNIGKNDGYIEGEIYGNAMGYAEGFTDGQLSEYEPLTGLEWIESFLGLFAVIFAIELLPNITIGLIAGVPIVFGVLWWFLRLVRG